MNTIMVADDVWRITEHYCLTRSQFERCFISRNASQIIMEACGSAHHLAHWFNSLGIDMRLLPLAISVLTSNATRPMRLTPALANQQYGS